MATVIHSGSVGRQPVRGEMRHFIVRARVDGRTSTVLATDTNKAFIIPAGWLVQRVWARMTVIGSTTGAGNLLDSAGASWGATYPIGALGTTGATVLAGGSTGLIGALALAGGKFYPSADYILASFSVTFD
jgi:hypothetical protein